jgi:hypothetical protein
VTEQRHLAQTTVVVNEDHAVLVLRRLGGERGKRDESATGGSDVARGVNGRHESGD